MKQKIAALAVGILTAATMVATPTDAMASTNTNTVRGIVITTPHNRTVHNGKKTTVRPSVHVKAGQHRQVHSYKIAAYTGGHRVAYGKTVRLRPGTYRLRVNVSYRNWHWVAKTRTVRTFHPGDGGLAPDDTLCTVTAVDSNSEVTTADCTASEYPGQTTHSSQTDGSASFCPDEQAPYTEGETLHGNLCASGFHAYYTYSTQHYRAKAYTRYRRLSSPRRTLIVKNKVTHKPKPTPVHHSCTVTSSGTCIQGGEFCPVASEGHTGYDANGTAYVCTDSDHDGHPHWE
ncbi:hypothetical protein [uncultured Jatrophihabitans sp.]|uniref:hypothetical protein n=1 Tax=uncultured Jatrophihabitans sp. TaxID=1610747 RepID=UPI0035CC9C3C